MHGVNFIMNVLLNKQLNILYRFLCPTPKMFIIKDKIL